MEHLKAPLEAEAARLMEYPIVKETFAKKDIPVHVQDTMGTGGIKIGPGQYEAGVKGVYVPEKLGARERIYLAEDTPTEGMYIAQHPYPRTIMREGSLYEYNAVTGKYETGDMFGKAMTPEEAKAYVRPWGGYETTWDVTSRIQDVLRHEIGHPLMERLQAEWLQDNPKAQLVDKKIKELKKEWEPSQYGSTSEHEWIAEGFAKFTHPDFPKVQDMPPRVKEFFTRMVNAAKMSDIDVTGLSVLLKVGGAAIAYEVLFGDKETKEKIAGLASMVAFHGTPEHNVRKIAETGHLKPWGAKGVEKLSGGNMTEKGLVWVTPDELIAHQYANALEANMFGGKDYKPGAIFKADIPDNIKLIDRNHKLTQEQVDILNPHLPEYKPLHEGDSFYAWEYRSNGKPLSQAIRLLGYDGMTYGEKQIALLADKLPVEMHKDLRGTGEATAKTSAPEVHPRRYMYDKISPEKEVIIKVDKTDLPVIKNPSPSQIQYMIDASRNYWKEQGGVDPVGTERILRMVTDKNGNRYFWDGASAIHNEVVKKLKLEGAVEGYVTKDGKAIQYKDSKNVDIGKPEPIFNKDIQI